MHPYLHAQKHPEKPACIFAATGEVVTYRQLDERSNQGAHLLRSLGLKRGDVIAVCMENNRATSRSRGRISARACTSSASRRSSPLRKSSTSSRTAARSFHHFGGHERARRHASRRSRPTSCIHGGRRSAGYQSWDAALADMPATPDCRTKAPARTCCIPPARPVVPKGVKFPLSAEPIDAPTTLVQLASKLYGVDAARCISHRRRCITPRRCAGAWLCSISADWSC